MANRRINLETIAKLQQTIETSGGYRKAAKILGVSHAAVWNVAHARSQDVSLRAENRLRAALGLAPVPARVEIDACPDCGGVHVGRCHGREVEVRPVRRPKPVTRIADMSIAQLRATIANRSEYP